uniref:Uncharacterized protein n=1 Tax=Rhizophagus irregularis (strain DAOM 181602 / DAOM 197198 / MUCL 43194) TaxID=747089 RepID=U9T979_RHIID
MIMKIISFLRPGQYKFHNKNISKRMRGIIAYQLLIKPIILNFEKLFIILFSSFILLEIILKKDKDNVIFGIKIYGIYFVKQLEDFNQESDSREVDDMEKKVFQNGNKKNSMF